jgi:hypothetical protein
MANRFDVICTKSVLVEERLDEGSKLRQLDLPLLAQLKEVDVEAQFLGTVCTSVIRPRKTRSLISKIFSQSAATVGIFTPSRRSAPIATHWSPVMAIIAAPLYVARHPANENDRVLS